MKPSEKSKRARSKLEMHHSLSYGRMLLSGTLLIGLMLLYSCKEPEIPETNVNPAFEMNPPLARDVSIKRVDRKDGNLLVVADFGQEAIASRYHAIELSTGKVVLRDDGHGGDEQAGDGKFSVVLNEDIDALTEDLEEVNRNWEKILAELEFEIKGRHLVKLDREKLIRPDIEAFKGGRFLPIPPGVFCRLLLNVSIPHSLLVTNLGTVEDTSRIIKPCTNEGHAGGAWTFEKLMTDMANTASTGVSVDEFVKDWLETWLNTTSVNSEAVVERDALFSTIIQPWAVSSGSTDVTITNWKTKTLTLSKAPFKLLAIVNRLDLRGNIGYGVSNAGEGRFVFGVLSPGSCSPLAFTVIFEYGIPIRSCQALKAYGQKWYDLKNHALGSAAYNDALQELTDVFAAANADPSRPNGNALNQIRTNEIAIGSGWELREFNIDSATHKLELTTVKQEPAEKYNNSSPANSPPDVANLVAWVAANESQILLDKHTVPAELPGAVPFLGGKANGQIGKWTVPGAAVETRHHFSFNTCTGCHREETQTSFTHLSTVGFGTESMPSGFLAGITATDPIDASVTHTFNDLLIRQNKLEDLLCTNCRSGFRELLGVLTFNPTKMVH